MAHHSNQPLPPGLYFVATPIGSARDITLRALDILASADVLAAEDTRSLRSLMEIHGIDRGGRDIWPYHDHNGAKARPRLLDMLRAGRSVAYCAEAGTPLVADPGYRLAVDAIADGVAVTSAPGASAAVAALTVSGLPSDRFLFAGFAPPQAGARARWMAEIGAVPATLIIYESPRRVHRFLKEACDMWGSDRPAALCRELTKRFEEVLRGTLSTLSADLADRALKGEVVLVVGRPPLTRPSAKTVEEALLEALKTERVKDAATRVAAALDLPRRDVYQIALDLQARE